MFIISEQKENEKGFIINFSYTITGNELISATKQIYDNDPENTHLWELWNFMDIDNIQVTSDEVKQLSDLDKEIAGSRHTKLIIAAALPTDFAFGFGRMYEALVDHPKIITHMFHELNEAKNWIDNIKSLKS
jgi:hypothetical protein